MTEKKFTNPVLGECVISTVKSCDGEMIKLSFSPLAEFSNLAVDKTMFGDALRIADKEQSRGAIGSLLGETPFWVVSGEVVCCSPQHLTDILESVNDAVEIVRELQKVVIENNENALAQEKRDNEERETALEEIAKLFSVDTHVDNLNAEEIELLKTLENVRAEVKKHTN